MKIKTIENGIRLENDGKSLEVTIVNEKWITVHPNGKENKGRHLLLEDGETPADAIERKWGSKKAKDEKESKKDDANLVDRESESSGELKELEHLLKQNDKEYTSSGYRNIKHFDDKDEYLAEWNRLTKEQPSVYEDIDLKKIKTAVFKSDAGYTMLKYVDKDLSDDAKEMAKKRYSVEQKEEQPKQEEKKTIDNIEDFVVSRSNGGYYASAKETRLYKNGNSTARVEELEGGHYAVELKRNGVSIAHKYYTTKSGAEKALKEHLAGFEAKKLEKTNLDEKRQAYEDIKKAYDENDSKRWNAKDDKEYMDAYEKAEVAKKALTKARREYAESIMANFEEASENPYEERQQARKERYEELSGRAQDKSDAIGKSASDRLGAIPFGEPIHSREDRNRREKIWSQFGKSYEEQQKAEHYAEKAKSVGTAGISSDDANAIAKLAVKYNSGTIDSAEKRRIIDRVIDIDKRNRMLKQQEESGEKQDYSDLGFDVERNGDINRLQLKFSGIPSGDIRAKLKSHGFRWSPREGAWQRQLGTNAEWSFKRLVEELRKKGE